VAVENTSGSVFIVLDDSISTGTQETVSVLEDSLAILEGDTAELTQTMAAAFPDSPRQSDDDGDEEEEDSTDENLEVYRNLCSLFPNVDPDFLKAEAERIGGDVDQMNQFVEQNVGKSSLPSRKEYEQRLATTRQLLQIRRMRVADFLAEYDNPGEHFMATAAPVSQEYRDWARFYLAKKFPNNLTAVDAALNQHNGHFLPALKHLNATITKPSKRIAARGGGGVGASPRRPEQPNVGFLREYIYTRLEADIQAALTRRQHKYEERVAAAVRSGAVFECACCFDSECLLEEACTCEGDHMFCRVCVRRGCEVQIGENKHKMVCFQDGCEKEFPVSMLQLVLKPRLWQRLLQRRQAEEVTAAGLADLVQCPACEFAVEMPDPGYKVVECGNPECGKVTCRDCKEESHLPLSCQEVEKDSETKARTQLENVMTEAMLRTCPSCQNRFFKTEGCNKMVCKCGAILCYICRKAITTGYSHFYGQGASPEEGKCPLFSDNKMLHQAEIFKAAEEAKKTLPAGLLKTDPARNLAAPPAGINLHRQNFLGGGYDQGEEEDEDEEDEDDDDDEVDEDDDVFDDEDEVDYYNNLLEEDDEDEVGYRPQDW